MINVFWIKLKNWNEQNKKWFWGAIAAITAAIIPLIFFPRSVEEPKFIIKNSILRSDATLVIKANNKKANQKKNLDIIFDGCSFPKKATPVAPNSDGMHLWHFTLINHTKVDHLTKDGEHKVKVSFPGGKNSDEFKIIFVNDPLIVDGEIIQSDPKKKILKGKATTKTRIPENEIKVDVTFYHEDSIEEQISVPVKKVEYQDTGHMHFEFETPIENFPEISTDDSRYSEIFFSFRVSDKAGNEYYYEESYGQYVTGGIKRFGALNADFNIDKTYDDKKQSLNSAFLVKPKYQSFNKIPSITLKVTTRIVNLKSVRRLDWQSNIPRAKSLAFVYRDNDKIGESETNTYTDTEPLYNATAKYHVELSDESGITYKSNTAVYTMSISEPNRITQATLTVRSNVYDDTVYIDGKKYGSTRLDVIIPFGRHKLYVEKVGYLPYIKLFDFQKKTIIRAELLSLQEVTDCKGGAIKLRSIPTILSKENIISIVKKNKFYVSNYNKSGNSQNKYVNNYDGTITDLNTGLMWQQSGSDEYMTYMNCTEYIKNLNIKKFAGYDDWRIPSIDELMSLIEKNDSKLYISDLFNPRQQFCWSSDKYSGDSSGIWGVGFIYGKVKWNNENAGSYIRCVRCLESTIISNLKKNVQ